MKHHVELAKLDVLQREICRFTFFYKKGVRVHGKAAERVVSSASTSKSKLNNSQLLSATCSLPLATAESSAKILVANHRSGRRPEQSPATIIADGELVSPAVATPSIIPIVEHQEQARQLVGDDAEEGLVVSTTNSNPEAPAFHDAVVEDPAVVELAPGGVATSMEKTPLSIDKVVVSTAAISIVVSSAKDERSNNGMTEGVGDLDSSFVVPPKKKERENVTAVAEEEDRVVQATVSGDGRASFSELEERAGGEGSGSTLSCRPNWRFRKKEEGPPSPLALAREDRDTRAPGSCAADPVKRLKFSPMAASSPDEVRRVMRPSFARVANWRFVKKEPGVQSKLAEAHYGADRQREAKTALCYLLEPSELRIRCRKQRLAGVSVTSREWKEKSRAEPVEEAAPEREKTTTRPMETLATGGKKSEVSWQPRRLEVCSLEWPREELEKEQQTTDKEAAPRMMMEAGGTSRQVSGSPPGKSKELAKMEVLSPVMEVSRKLKEEVGGGGILPLANSKLPTKDCDTQKQQGRAGMSRDARWSGLAFDDRSIDGLLLVREDCKEHLVQIGGKKREGSMETGIRATFQLYDLLCVDVVIGTEEGGKRISALLSFGATGKFEMHPKQHK
ncbi:unnamed protein product [Linum tenue]|uniref:Uncharacterized protein n=1 Tax=Linum tenue TaxID=586396 RepID=A0AAV0IT04_9ROSI|nr:unnamed protein product [Linum tenue]